MANFDYTTVQTILAKPLAPGKPPRDFYESVGRAYGIHPASLSKASYDELGALVKVARGSVWQAEAVAERISSKYRTAPERNPIFDGDDAPKSTPLPAPAPRVDSDAIVKRVVDVVRPQVNKAVEEADNLRADVTETLLKFSEALPQVVLSHVNEALSSARPTNLVITLPDSEPVSVGLSHRKTGAIIKALAAGVNVYLHGPAGSGKTTVARKCAEAFSLAFYFNAKVESEYMLLGFKDARGETVRTQFREAYEHGGVFLFDELDGSSPSAVVALNAALANGVCPFPDGVVNRHYDFKCIAAGNTKLGGASREYVGRNQLDAASIDRFSFIEFGYDEALERALASDHGWCDYVQSARRAVAQRALKHLITPRATLDGCKLLAAGFEADDVETMVLWKGLDADTVRQLKGTMDVKAYKAPAPVEIL